MKPGCCLLLLCLAGRLMAADAPVAAQKQPPATNAPSKPFLPETLRHFQVKPGFRLEVAAAEGVVSDPIAMAFDENNRLFVLESPGASTPGSTATGRVRLLEDSNTNGIYDTSIVYADNLPNSTAIICYDGGVFVAAGGQILYLKDTKGMGAADVRREVFRGFGDATNGANGQVIITSLVWGLDNRIHASTLGHGGDVISSSVSPGTVDVKVPASRRVGGQSVVLQEGAFSFDPRALTLTAESGSGASGMCFDDRGRKFICSPTEPVRNVPFALRYETQNPFYQLPSGIDLYDRATQPSRMIYPPVRPGMPGLAPMPFTAASGIAIYRGNAFPRDYLGDAFAIDSTANVVHHVKIQANGLELALDRPPDEPTSEFIAGWDGSFQPMQIVNAPDGALYVAGLSRALPTGKTNAIVTGIPVHGRIYRIVPTNFQQPKLPPMRKMPSSQLATMLMHPNGWHRDTAARLLYERQDLTTTAPLIRLLFDPQSPPLARMHALHALAGIEIKSGGRHATGLLDQHLLKGMIDPDERVREHAVLLSERFIANGVWPDSLWGQLSKMGGDPSPQVRLQLALSLGQSRNPGRAQVLAEIARTDIKAGFAVLCSANENAGDVFAMICGDPRVRNDVLGEMTLLPGLISSAAKQSQPMIATEVVSALQNVPEPKLAFEFALQLEERLAENGIVLPGFANNDVLKVLLTRAVAVVRNMNAEDSARVYALRFISVCGTADPVLATDLVNEWYSLRPWLQSEIIKAFCSKPEWTFILVSSMETGLIPRQQVPVEQIRFLLAYPDANLRQRTAALFANWPSLQRPQVVGRYRNALQMGASAERGRRIYLTQCAFCHQTADAPDGISFSYNLGEVAKFGKAALLVKILDPNRAAPKAYQAVLLGTKTGEFITGFVVRQDQRSVTLCRLDGQLRHVAGGNIASQGAAGISGMPEGFETVLNQQNMADLLEYLVTARR